MIRHCPKLLKHIAVKPPLQIRRNCTKILGIETSCDDTGVAVLNEHGDILGDAINSQLITHIRYGGIIPPIARNLHRQHIVKVSQQAIEKANISYNDIDAIAVTIKPGLNLSLDVGVEHAKMLSRTFHKSIIPIHHMEAHALVVRSSVKTVNFPFLVLLASGGHCQIALVQDVNQFLLLGTTLDDAPGEALDKTARRLKIHNLPECSNISGGAAIELLAKRGNPLAFDFAQPITARRDCSFSFSGLKHSVRKKILKAENEHGIEGDAIIPQIADICASFQHAIALHLSKRVQRAIMFCIAENLWPKVSPRQLVISGGVACNAYMGAMLRYFCDQYDVECHVPPRKLCNDNGIMIAWNGVEKWRRNIDIVRDKRDIEAIDYQAHCTLGTDISERVAERMIKTDRIKLDVAKILEYANNNYEAVRTNR